jgi:hypothetical protein
LKTVANIIRKILKLVTIWVIHFKICLLIDFILVGHVCRLNIILVAEGAIDREGKPISAEDVRKVNLLKKNLV